MKTKVLTFEGGGPPFFVFWMCINSDDQDVGNKIYWWESCYKCWCYWPLVHVILSMGYPLTGQTTENSLPTTARSSPSGWTWGGPRRRKNGMVVEGNHHFFLLWDSAGSNQAENAFTIDIQSGRMCCWSSPIGSLALVEATVLNRDLTYVDVADDFAMHRDILTDEQPAKQSVYNTAKNSWLCISEMADEVWQRLKSRSRRHKQNQEE